MDGIQDNNETFHTRQRLVYSAWKYCLTCSTWEYWLTCSTQILACRKLACVLLTSMQHTTYCSHAAHDELLICSTQNMPCVHYTNCTHKQHISFHMQVLTKSLYKIWRQHMCQAYAIVNLDVSCTTQVSILFMVAPRLF